MGQSVVDLFLGLPVRPLGKGLVRGYLLTKGKQISLLDA